MPLEIDRSADGARIEDPDNPDAWIEAEFPDGWGASELMQDDDGEAYAALVEPYKMQCPACREFFSPQFWGVEQTYCQACTYRLERGIGHWFKRTENGIEPGDTIVCPCCGADDVIVGVLADYDCRCGDCDEAFDYRGVSVR